MRRFRHEHALRFSPRASIAALIAIMPQISPCAPAAGDSATAGMPVIVYEPVATNPMSSSAPCTVDSGCIGWMSPKPGNRAIFSLRRGLCFIVQEPSGKMPGIDPNNSFARAACNGGRSRGSLRPGSRSRPCGASRRGGGDLRRRRQIDAARAGAPLEDQAPSPRRQRPCLPVAAIARAGVSPRRLCSSSCRGASQRLAQRGCRARSIISVGRQLGRGDEQEIVEPASGSSRLTGTPASMPLRGELIYERRGGPRQAQREFVEEALVHDLYARHARTAARRASRPWHG